MPINGEIKSDKIRLISESGEQLGIVSLADALKQAEQASLDLVQMAKDGDPLVCRFLITENTFLMLRSKKQLLRRNKRNNKLKKQSLDQ